MVLVKLEPRRLSRSPTAPSIDPEPNWTLDGLLCELNALETKLGYQTPSPLKQPLPRSRATLKTKKNSGGSKPFIMSISDDDFDYESDGKSEDGVDDNVCLVTGKRFSCVDFDLSDSDESGEELQTFQCMHKKSLEEDILLQLEREHQLNIKERVRSTISAFELYHQKEHERSQVALLQLEQYIEDRQEIDRRVDKLYQHNIAEVLDNHLSAVQRDHEQRSQIEERRIRDDAALEEAKQKEKALYEEKVQREKAKAEAEAREKAAKIAEQQRLALEASKRAAEEYARKESERVAAEAALKAAEHKVETGAKTIRERQQGDPTLEEPGIRVMAADAALKAETNRLNIFNDVAKEIPNIPQDLKRYGRKMFRIISQLTGSREDVRCKAQDFIRTFNDSGFPYPISFLIFAQQVVPYCENARGTDDRFVFACARVIVLVSSQAPSVLDFVMAEFHKACIYTVPKHLHPLNHAAKNIEYWKTIGYREEDNKLESSDSYLERVRRYMKLYAALIQTDIPGIKNPHGLEHGWAWLAMFLNELPPNISTAFALDAFLRMAGFALFKRYKLQFVKMLAVVSRSYLPALKRGDNKKLREIVNRLEDYLEGRVYQREPEGLRLEEGELLSGELF